MHQATVAPFLLDMRQWHGRGKQFQHPTLTPGIYLGGAATGQRLAKRTLSLCHLNLPAGLPVGVIQIGSQPFSRAM